ncbi:hypothetical protein B0H17DRAFT_1212405 [Mycena rosella]|uniref:Uncharacterized protein n=1 Tax=Mycena rosella TaxID=1033263 RepID=A0AAD7G310_MYCRO|nr:hypothetical protein B0H17DRAFT_1212405 [Mycena rosella]
MHSSSSCFLEHALYDVLQHIGAEPGLTPPGDLCRLLTTSRALYNGILIQGRHYSDLAIISLTFFINGTRLVSASDGTSIRLWEVMETRSIPLGNK